MLRLGFFPDFKGSDRVLLAADSDGVKTLVDAIPLVAANLSDATPIHDLARVSRNYPARLFVVAGVPLRRPVPPSTFYLDISGHAQLHVQGFLEPLLTAHTGHQYFDLVPKPVTLIVSVGEYDEYWWERVDA